MLKSLLSGCLSILVCTSLLGQNPAQIREWKTKGDAKMEQGLLSEAIPYYSKIIKAYKKQPGEIPDIYFKRAQAKAYTDQAISAIKDLNICLQFKPDFVDGYVLRSKLHENVENRIIDMEKAVKLDPSNLKYKQRLAMMKIREISQRIDYLKDWNIAFDMETLRKEYHYAQGGCQLLQSIKQVDRKSADIYDKYCASTWEEVQQF